MEINFKFKNKSLNHRLLLEELLSSEYCHKKRGLTFKEVIEIFDYNKRPVNKKKINDLLWVWKKRKKCDSTKKGKQFAYFIIIKEKGTKKPKTITFLLKKVKNKDEKEFIEEAIKCLSVGSGRSTIIMLWCATSYKIYREIERMGLNNFNKIYNKKYSNKKNKPKLLKKIDDFEYYPDSEVLIISEDLGIFDRTQRRILEDCLKLRNMCAHPGKYKPKEHKINSFIEDILEIVFN